MICAHRIVQFRYQPAYVLRRYSSAVKTIYTLRAVFKWVYFIPTLMPAPRPTPAPAPINYMALTRKHKVLIFFIQLEFFCFNIFYDNGKFVLRAANTHTTKKLKWKK